MADLVNVETELASRVLWIIYEASTRAVSKRGFWVTTGWRDHDEAVRLYQTYLKGGPLAAKPDESLHCRNPAAAVDLACDPIDNALRKQLIVDASLHTPYESEPWHVELVASKFRKPLPLPAKPLTLQKATTILGNNAVKILTTKSGLGYWVIADNGGVFTFGDAPFYGSCGDIILSAPIVDADVTSTGNGYRLLGKDGGVFNFGDAQMYGSAAKDNMLGYIKT